MLGKYFQVDQFVTGIVCGVLGCMNKNEASDGGGKFRVKQIFMPDIPAQIPRTKLEANLPSNPQIAFISGEYFLNITKISNLCTIYLRFLCTYNL